MAEARPLGSLIRFIKPGAKLQRGRSELGQTYRVIQVGNLSPDGITGDLELMRLGPSRVLEAEPGDVLLAQAVSNLRTSVLQEGEFGRFEPYAVGPNIAAIRVREELLDPYFLAGVLNSQTSRNRLSRLATGSATPTVPIDELKSFRIPWIPTGQQQPYVRLFRAASEIRQAMDSLRHAQSQRVEHFIVDLWGEMEEQG